MFCRRQWCERFRAPGSARRRGRAPPPGRCRDFCGSTMNAPICRVSFSPIFFHVLSAIDRFVDAGAVGGVAANGRFAGTHVNRRCDRRRDGDRADRRNVLLVEKRRPIRAAISRFPNAAGDGRRNNRCLVRRTRLRSPARGRRGTVRSVATACH